jgi:hypothetical protein
MNNFIIKKQNSKVKKVAPGAAKDYINDPYFVRKREEAKLFLGKQDCRNLSKIKVK